VVYPVRVSDLRLSKGKEMSREQKDTSVRKEGIDGSSDHVG